MTMKNETTVIVIYYPHRWRIKWPYSWKETLAWTIVILCGLTLTMPFESEPKFTHRPGETTEEFIQRFENYLGQN